jgi:hypothetical protein
MLFVLFSYKECFLNLKETKQANDHLTICLFYRKPIYNFEGQQPDCLALLVLL